MRKRNIQKIVRFNRKEAQDLAAKAKKACLSEAGWKFPKAGQRDIKSFSSCPPESEG